MAIALQGADSASVAPASATITLPAHAAGDVILIWAWNPNSTTLPTLPAGYTSLFTVSASTRGARLGYKVATSSAETSGNWVNARQLVVTIYRNVASLGTLTSGSASSSTITYPAATLSVVDGTSWVACFGAHRSATDVGAAPASLTLRTSVIATGSSAGLDTNAGVALWAGDSLSVNSSGVWSALSLELVAVPTGVTLSGQSATGAQGALGVAATLALTGQALAAARGSLGPALAAALTGQSATAAGGTLRPALASALTGQAATVTQGSLAVGGNVTVALSGQQATALRGDFTTQRALSLSGQALAAASGPLSPSGAVALTGEALTVQRGALEPGGVISAALVGQALTAASGALGVHYTVTLSGASLTVQQGLLAYVKPRAYGRIIKGSAKGSVIYGHVAGNTIAGVAAGRRIIGVA